MTFFRDNYPQIDATLLELSPFYLEEAKKNDERFRKYFKKSDPRASKVEMKPLKLVQGRAEKMLFADESFDILNCVYLFHEIPAEVRRECAKEFFRVLRPGGIVAWNDSIQAFDRDSLTKEVLGIFSSKYHEPFYNSYIEDDINAIFLEAGFVKGCEPIIANRSKV
jgi:ubiquinone/menaquinone biosynthesis C-methylase UbiE